MFFMFTGKLYSNILSGILALFALKGVEINEVCKALIDYLPYT